MSVVHPRINFSLCTALAVAWLSVRALQAEHLLVLVENLGRQAFKDPIMEESFPGSDSFLWIPFKTFLRSVRLTVKKSKNF